MNQIIAESLGELTDADDMYYDENNNFNIRISYNYIKFRT